MIAARDNPFATERSEALLSYDPTWIGNSWEAILARLDQLNWRASAVGPHGSGKTTFLEALEQKLIDRGDSVTSLFLNRESPGTIPDDFFAKLDSASIVLFDGAEQLGRRSWREFLRKTSHARGLVITAHKPGRLPTLIETKVTPEILQRCIRTLDKNFPLDDDRVELLFRRHSGNIREALLECYDTANSLPPIRTL